MGSLRQKPSGRWQALYRGPDRKQYGPTFATKRQAERFLNRTVTQIEDGKWRDPREGRRLFSDLVTTWRAQKTHLAIGTLYNYDVLLRTHLLPRFGDMPVISITKVQVREWSAGLQRSGVGAVTVVNAWTLLAQIMNLAVEDDMIASSPVPKTGPTAPKPRRGRALTTQQLLDLVDAFHPHHRTMILSLAYTGMRWGETIGLRPERIDLLHRTITVAEQLVEVNGHLHLSQLKTEKSARIIEVPPFLVPLLEAQISLGAEFVFSTPTGRPLSCSNFRKRYWRPATLQAGLDGLRVHDLRHTHVSWLIAQNANPLEISRRLGHGTNVAFTLSRYAHLFPGADRQLAEGLDALHRQAVDEPLAAVHLLPYR